PSAVAVALRLNGGRTMMKQRFAIGLGRSRRRWDPWQATTTKQIESMSSTRPDLSTSFRPISSAFWPFQPDEVGYVREEGEFAVQSRSSSLPRGYLTCSQSPPESSSPAASRRPAAAAPETGGEHHVRWFSHTVEQPLGLIRLNMAGTPRESARWRRAWREC